MLSNYPAQALLLTDGRVLLSHQVDVDATRPGELFDPVRGNFQALPQGVGPRSVATLLSNGKVLFWESEKGATIYDPSTNSYSPGGGFCWGIAGTWSRLLADGRVLCRAENFVLFSTGKSALLYNPRTNSTSPTTAAASRPDVLLPGGLVFILGDTKVGLVGQRSPNVVYDPSTDQIIPVPVSTVVPNPDFVGLLPDGRVASRLPLKV